MSRRSRSSNQSTEWEVIEIVAEDGKLFQVRWAGNDPETGKPWPLDWIPSSHCSTDLVKAWERKKVKKQASLASAPTSTPPLASGVRERPSGKRNVASTSEPPVPSSRKRKHRILSGSPGSTDGDSVPSRKQKLTNAVEGANGSDRDRQATAHAPSRPSKGDRSISEASPSHPPLEEIEMWVPTPNAKFGPPKRKRAAGERQSSRKDRPKSVALPTETPTQPSKALPSSQRPLTLSESQIIALREEEEEESQPLFPDLQFPSSPSEGPTPNSAPSDSLPPPAGDVSVSTEVPKANSLGLREQFTRQTSGDVQLSNPDASEAGVPEPNDQSIHIQPDATNASMQGGDATDTLKGITPLPTASHLSLINPDPSSSAVSSSKPPQLEKPAQSGPPPIWKPGATSAEQPTSKNELLRSGNGTLAERRAFEARARLDELRRAASAFGGIAKGHTGALKTIQSPERAPPHVILKRVMDGMESPNQSQITALRNSGNEIPSDASPSEHHRVESSADRSKEEMVLRNKSDNSANVDLLHQQDDVVAADVPVVRGDELSSEDEVPPTASDSRRSQSHNPSPDASLGSQLAAALDLLHKKSEEISELRAQVASVRRRITDDDSKLVHMQVDKPLNGKERMGYLTVEVQTDRDHGDDARWAQEKAVLQGELDALRGDKARALADVDFFREQYQRASAFASTTRTENEELLARATLAESQAVNGVAMVRATVEARVAKLEAEVRKYKALSEMLTKRARRTDDEVRYRAALMPELEREFGELHRQFRETEAELEETGDELRAEKRANVKLKRRLAILEARAPSPDDAEASREQEREGVFWSDNDEDDEDYRPGPADSPSSPPRAGSDGSSPQHGESHISPNVEREDDAQPPDGELEQLASVGLDVSAQSSNDDMVYLCRWRPGDPKGYCDAVVSSRQELHEHVVSQHLSCH